MGSKAVKLGAGAKEEEDVHGRRKGEEERKVRDLEKKEKRT